MIRALLLSFSLLAFSAPVAAEDLKPVEVKVKWTVDNGWPLWIRYATLIVEAEVITSSWNDDVELEVTYDYGNVTGTVQLDIDSLLQNKMYVAKGRVPIQEIREPDGPGRCIIWSSSGSGSAYPIYPNVTPTCDCGYLNVAFP